MTNISIRENVQSKKLGNLPFFFFFIFFLRGSGCCYGYCDQFCDWWIELSGPSMIGCFNCAITGVRLQATVQLQLYKVISEI